MGRGRKDWKFLHKMAGCLGQNPKVNPAFTFDASSESQASRSESLSATKTAVMKVLVMKSREKGTETSQAAQTKWSFVSH